MYDFDIKNPVLPEAIKEAAFQSGGFPHDEKMKEEKYEAELRLLQIELLKAQNHVKEKGLRVVVIFEGRDAAGKGGAIARITEHLSPRAARVAALSKPSEAEASQFYLQRYIKELPSAGSMLIFDRSWYNRAVVEPVMGFCTLEQSEQFIEMIPNFEKMLVDDGVILIKFWLHVGHAMQLKRLHKRYHDILSRWKLSPVDYAAIGKWDDYTKAIENMLEKTDAPPWTIIRANDKARTRLATLREILKRIDYGDKDMELVNQTKKIVMTASDFLKAGGEE
jgi:polyphosphate kinase